MGAGCVPASPSRVSWWPVSAGVAAVAGRRRRADLEPGAVARAPPDRRGDPGGGRDRPAAPRLPHRQARGRRGRGRDGGAASSNTSGTLDQDPIALAELVANLKVPVIAWVGPVPAKAAGAGLLLMYASSLAAVQPGAQVGPLMPARPRRIPTPRTRASRSRCRSGSTPAAKNTLTDWQRPTAHRAGGPRARHHPGATPARSPSCSTPSTAGPRSRRAAPSRCTRRWRRPRPRPATARSRSGSTASGPSSACSTASRRPR